MPLFITELLPELSMNKTPFKFALPSVSINPELFTDVPTSNLIVGLLLEVILDDSIVPAFSKV